MKWTMPRPSRACCCLPLRRGLIACVYLNLVLTVGFHAAFVFTDYIKLFTKSFTMTYAEYLSLSGRSKVNDFTVLIFVFGGAAAEIAMTVVALVGLHMKRIKLVRAYLFFTVVYTILMIVLRTLNIHVKSNIWEIDVPAIFLFLVMKVYYILLLRSQYKKMEDKDKQEKSQVELRNVNFTQNSLRPGDETGHAHLEKYENSSDRQILVSEKGVEEMQADCINAIRVLQ